MSLSMLSRVMGGSPGPSFLSKIEAGKVDTTSSLCIKLADALSLPREVMLNASGYATPDQHQEGLNRLAALIGSPAPVMANLPVVDGTDPDVPMERLPHRKRLLKKPEDAFVIDLHGPENEPFVGEVLASRERRPRPGQAVIAVVDGKTGAWTFQSGRPTGDFLERPNGDRVGQGAFKILGVIIRVTSELDLDSDE